MEEFQRCEHQSDKCAEEAPWSRGAALTACLFACCGTEHLYELRVVLSTKHRLRSLSGRSCVVFLSGRLVSSTTETNWHTSRATVPHCGYKHRVGALILRTSPMCSSCGSPNGQCVSTAASVLNILIHWPLYGRRARGHYCSAVTFEICGGGDGNWATTQLEVWRHIASGERALQAPLNL